MKKYLISALLGAVASIASAQVQNYALQFSSPDAVVNLGTISRFTDAENFTLQFWFCPDDWTEGASIIRCGNFAINLGKSKQLLVTDGSSEFTFTNTNLGVNKWAQVTLRSTPEDGAILTINNAKSKSSPTPLSLPAKDKSLWLGGNFSGRIDEVRLWNGSLPEDYESYWRNTLNELTPSWKNLAGYWKMDQEQCANVVDYRGSAHGTMSTTGVEKVAVTDNDLFKYRINLAYGNIQRFFDRKIDARHYSLSNRICIIGGGLNTSDGSVNLHNPRYDATIAEGQWVEKVGARKGVIDLSGGAITLPSSVLSGEMGAYAVEMWLYLDEWTEGATVFKKGNKFAITLGDTESQTFSITCNGETQPIGTHKFAIGKWIHLGVSTSGTNGFIVEHGGGSTVVEFSAAVALSGVTGKPTIGTNLKGKIDDFAIWSAQRSVADMTADSQRLPLADADNAVAGSTVWQRIAAYDFSDPETPGYDRFSVQNYFRTMRSYTEGMRGVKFILTINAEGFESCLANETKRAKVISDMVKLCKDEAFDGIDLDFEWTYSAAGWANIATVVEGIRKKVGADKIISVSPHWVAYSYPTDKMADADYFNFQIYGPGDTELFTRQRYTAAIDRFVNHGYSKEKIVMSYATTTSGGRSSIGGPRVANTAPGFYPAGYAGIYNASVKPEDDIIYHEGNNCYYYLTGVDQTVWRTQQVQENDLGGIMYWDLGNDLPASNKASLARVSSYALNSNVEKLVPEVSSVAPAPENDPFAPVGENGIQEVRESQYTPTYDLQGRIVHNPRGGIFIKNGKKIIVK